MTRKVIQLFSSNFSQNIFTIFLIMSSNLRYVKSQNQSVNMEQKENKLSLYQGNANNDTFDIYFNDNTSLNFSNRIIFYFNTPATKNSLENEDSMREIYFCIGGKKNIKELMKITVVDDSLNCLKFEKSICLSLLNLTKQQKKFSEYILRHCSKIRQILKWSFYNKKKKISKKHFRNLHKHKIKRSLQLTKPNIKPNSSLKFKKGKNILSFSKGDLDLLSLNLETFNSLKKSTKYEDDLHPVLYKKNNFTFQDKPIQLSNKHAYLAELEMPKDVEVTSSKTDFIKDAKLANLQEIHITKRSNLTINHRTFPQCPEINCKNDQQIHSSSQLYQQRKFCRCDSLCKVFNDCCQVPTSTDEGFLLPSLEPQKIACTQLLPSIQKQTQFNPAAYMVNGCMKNSSLLLVEKCSGTPKTQGVHSYLLDIPVISNVTGIMYKNIFCAACNKDAKLRSLKGLMSCNTKPKGSLFHFIKKVKYIPGSLTWQSDENACVLQIQYGEENIRWCEKNIVENCSISWIEEGIENNSDISHNCSYITAYVESDTTIYKNSYCAMCNNENPSSLRCFKDKEIEFIFEYNIPINGLYEPSEMCDDNHFWDPVYEVCLPSIGELMNGSVKINKIKSPFEEANFKLSCRTTIRKHSFSVLYPNGTIYLRKSRLYFHSGEYEVMDSKWIKICVPSDYWTTPMKILSLLLLTISMICLALHMIIFLLLPKRRNIPSMNLFSLSFALFISELIYACFFNYQSLTILCQVSAILLYYFLSSAFIWMNVMSIDICRTFRSSTYKIKSKKVFVQYSLYAWILPVFPTTIVIAVDKFASKDFILIPDLGSETCWFNNIWGHAFFFTIPAGLIVLINMVLYGFSVWGIYTQHKLGKLAAASVQQNEKKKQIKTPSIKSTCTDIHSPTNKTIMSTHSSDFEKSVAEVVSVPLSSLSNSSPSVTDLTSAKYMKEKNNSCSLKGRFFRETENFFQDKIRESIQKKMKINKKNRIRLILYSKLALIMGMTWIFAFLSIHTQSILLEYLFIIFNGCQGTVIFFSFDCKKIIWKELKEKFGWKISKDIDVSLNEVSKTYPEQATYTHTEKYS